MGWCVGGSLSHSFFNIVVPVPSQTGLRANAGWRLQGGGRARAGWGVRGAATLGTEAPQISTNITSMSARVRANLKSNLSHTDSVRLRLLLKICTDTILLPPHTLWFMLFPRCVGYLPIYVSHSYPLSHYQEARLSLFCKRHALSIEHSRKEASQLSTHLPMRPPSASTSFCKRCGNSRQRDVSLKAVPRRDARRTIQMGRL